MNSVKFILALALFAVSIQALLPFTAKDMHSLNKLSSPVVVSKNEFAVYSVKKWDSTTGISTSHLEAVEFATSERFIFMSPPNPRQSDFNPVFSDNFPETIFFLSTRSGSTQIWKTSLNQNTLKKGILGTQVQLSNYPVEISNLKIMGNTIGFTAETYIECSNLECTADKDAEVAKRGTNTWAVYDSLFVRHWDRWVTEKVSHVFLHILNNSAELLGDVIDMMPQMKTNSPVPPNGGAEQFDFHPNIREVVFTGQDRSHDEAWSTGWKIYKSSASSSVITPQHITKNIQARTQQPKYSSDGNKIAYLAMDKNGLESDKLHLEVYDIASEESTNISGSWDRSIIDYIWVDSNVILILATDFGVNKVFSINITSPQIVTTIVEDLASTVLILKVTENLFLLQRSSYVSPDDLFLLTLDKKKVTQLTNINPELTNFAISTPESFLFEGGYKDQVQGWLMRPINFDATKKYPVAFLIHGGPEGAWESMWSYRWNPQLWNSRGYAVVMINPHGSSGQGQKYQDLVRNDWGGVPYFDLMTGLDYALSKYTFLDGNRSCAVGASYGGYMVNWIQGQTDRFKCLVTHDGVFSTLTMFYATEELWFPMSEYCPFEAVGCKPWDDQYRDRYLKFSPESYVANWKTPHMIIHGSKDYRIPISEGISAFTALQIKKIPSKFVHFTQENHWVLRSENSIKWYDEVLGWLDKYTAVTLVEEKSIKFLEETS